MKFLGYDLRSEKGGYYDASTVYWHEPVSKVMRECRKQGLEIVQMGGVKTCFRLILKKKEEK